MLAQNEAGWKRLTSWKRFDSKKTENKKVEFGHISLGNVTNKCKKDDMRNGKILES